MAAGLRSSHGPGRVEERPFALQPILDRYKAEDGRLAKGQARDLGMSALARLLGEHTGLCLNSEWKRVYRWARLGLTYKQADFVAVKVFKTHPALIWPHWFDDVEPEVDGGPTGGLSLVS